MSVDLSLLPPPQVVEPLSYEAIFEARKARLLELTDEPERPALAATLALEAEPLTILLQESAYQEMLLRQRVNEAAKSVMLAYASGADLDHLAALLDVQRLEGESDHRLRHRAQLSSEGKSTAGPVLSYVFHALSASPMVRDVYVSSPAPGEVRATILANPDASNPNGVPGPDLLATVQAALSADDVRPLCDTVSVAAANVTTYTVSAALICMPGPDVAVVVSLAQATCQQYVNEQFKLGRDITISGLHAALHQPGVMRVDLATPATTLVIGPDSAARCTGVSVTLAGVGL